MSKKYKINTRTGKFDMINDGPSTNSITSEDGSINVTDTEDGVDLSVPLVTEQRNGLEHSFDKLVRDHSFMNIISVDSSNSYATAKEANQSLMDSDDEYYPVSGQMIEFVGTDGKLHVFRYNGNYIIRKDGVKEWWCGCTYDFKNNVWLINRNSSGGSKLRIARSSSALFWTITDYPDSSVEKYVMMASASFGSVVMSGNQSREYSFTTDGGDTTWEDKTLAHSYYYHSVKRAIITINNVEKEVILFVSNGKTMYITSDDDNNIVEGDFIDQGALLNSFGKNLNISESTYRTDVAPEIEVAYIDGVQNIFVSWRYNTDKFHITWIRNNQEVYTYDFDDNTYGAYRIKYNNGKLYCFNGDLGDLIAEYKATVLSINDDDTITEAETYYDTHCLIPTSYGVVAIINHKQIMINDENDEVVELPIELANDEYLTTTAFDGDKRVLVVTGGHQYNEERGNYAFLIDVERKKVLNNDEWEEIAIITEEFSGIVTSENAQLKPLALNDYLEYDKAQRKLSAIASDRSSEYKNYRLTGSKIEECWCEVALDDIVDNTTKVYSDEECTTELGTILRHGYNPNNPLDVLIYVSGTVYVVRFKESKIPVSLATTKALIEAVGYVEDILNEING